MKFISLFAGIGGFDLALEMLGHECVYANDFNKYAAQIYDKNFQNIKSSDGVQQGIDNRGGTDDGVTCVGTKPLIDTRDITTVDEREIPEHDLLVGGFPCQSFSIAGKRRGFEDTRGTMFFEVARILKHHRPRLLILENVKGLLSHDNGRTFKVIIATLTELGYDLQWQVLNSKNFGVPQNRERVFIIGNLRGTPRPKVFPFGRNDGKVIKETEQICATLKARYPGDWNGNYIRQIIGGGQGLRVYDPAGISTTLASNAGGTGAKTGLYAIAIDHGEVKKKEIATTLDANYWKGLDNHQARTGIAVPVLTPDRVNKRQNGRRFKEDGDPSFTLTGQDKHGVYDGIKIRRLTPTECERLQGFPDGWTEGISDTQRYKCLGNAVTVNVVYEIAKRL